MAKSFYFAKKANREVKIEENKIDDWVKKGYSVYKSSDLSTAVKSPATDATAKLNAEIKTLKAENEKLKAEIKTLTKDKK